MIRVQKTVISTLLGLSLAYTFSFLPSQLAFVKWRAVPDDLRGSLASHSITIGGKKRK